jgi:hypothetical protein
MERLKAVTVIIENHDNKLTQRDWAHLVQSIGSTIFAQILMTNEDGEVHMQFYGSPPSNSLVQNYCWVFEIEEFLIKDLNKELKQVAGNYNKYITAIVGDKTSIF